ncbi:Zn-finger domain associated with topoisomerase type I [Hahella chejuensis KCTC 2396]|uniref:Zn-finger domain associated with topoisomerase type I n=1 Tax=Hahella chejuensis (strain KCTC 2396) TaxID=349521 RepID=Q2SG76_HAHCH|nr:topoisomerase DNA-binding C4 zinc finger domain-containing protein [Hahella chejuensis]ABC30348.1 Zn-finger domain associated with topoisomerase type I [Hahella chejuensis KCTC 2396]
MDTTLEFALKFWFLAPLAGIIALLQTPWFNRLIQRITEQQEPPAPSPLQVMKVAGATPPKPTQRVRICPQCGARMVSRRVKKGPSAGREFFSCSAYPKCTGVRAA